MASFTISETFSSTLVNLSEPFGVTSKFYKRDAIPNRNAEKPFQTGWSHLLMTLQQQTLETGSWETVTLFLCERRHESTRKVDGSELTTLDPAVYRNIYKTDVERESTDWVKSSIFTATK